ncbi:HugZ family protein [Ancylobacter sp.]|uniref:HugZ family pyridoxamine 5'-phosphate oxidase n=1 Tax=Ancylobacter sp. TaxID=1872567 RepID=UPI003C79EBDC
MPATSTTPDTFDAARAVKRLVRESQTGALATLDADGAPYASLVQLATLPDGAPLLLLSQLARHTVNLQRDSRVSLLVDEHRTGDELQGARAGLKGRIAALTEPEAIASARRRYLARHPDAAGFAGFSDFAFYRLEVESAHLVAGFGRIKDVDGAALVTRIDDAAGVLAAEEGAVAHMNADHADAIQLYALHLIGTGPGHWKLVGLDPEGCDLMDGTQVRRLDFGQRVTNAQEMRAALVERANAARASAVQ